MNRAGVSDLIARLEAVYGISKPFIGLDPLEELIACILSQHTSDLNSRPAYLKLREKYPTWDEVAAASPEALADTIRRAGLANQKAKAILLTLAEINSRNNGFNLDNLSKTSVLEARDWLLSLPGVGPKTASIVLCFALNKGVVPVDTHVFRVGWRLGLYQARIGEAKAHDVLLKVVPPDMAFRFHMAVIQHGRNVCKAPVPLCEACEIKDICRWFKCGGPEKRKAELHKKRQTRLRQTKQPSVKKSK